MNSHVFFVEYSIYTKLSHFFFQVVELQTEVRAFAHSVPSVPSVPSAASISSVSSKISTQEDNLQSLPTFFQSQYMKDEAKNFPNLMSSLENTPNSTRSTSPTSFLSIGSQSTGSGGIQTKNVGQNVGSSRWFASHNEKNASNPSSSLFSSSPWLFEQSSGNLLELSETFPGEPWNSTVKSGSISQDHSSKLVDDFERMSFPRRSSKTESTQPDPHIHSNDSSHIFTFTSFDESPKHMDRSNAVDTNEPIFSKREVFRGASTSRGSSQTSSDSVSQYSQDIQDRLIIPLGSNLFQCRICEGAVFPDVEQHLSGKKHRQMINFQSPQVLFPRMLEEANNCNNAVSIVNKLVQGLKLQQGVHWKDEWQMVESRFWNKTILDIPLQCLLGVSRESIMIAVANTRSRYVQYIHEKDVLSVYGEGIGESKKSSRQIACLAALENLANMSWA